MNGRYPEDSNIVDFIYIKLISLAELYAATRRDDMAEACYTALDKYLNGTVDIIFKGGEPWLTQPKERDTLDIIEEYIANSYEVDLGTDEDGEE